MSLREIDAMRVDGKFVDAAGNKAEGQYVSPTLRFILPTVYANSV